MSPDWKRELKNAARNTRKNAIATRRFFHAKIKNFSRKNKEVLEEIYSPERITKADKEFLRARPLFLMATIFGLALIGTWVTGEGIKNQQEQKVTAPVVEKWVGMEPGQVKGLAVETFQEMMNSGALGKMRGAPGPKGESGIRGEQGPQGPAGLPAQSSISTSPTPIIYAPNLIYSTASSTSTPSMSEGSVPFEGSTGLDEDNDNLFFDASARLLGIGTSNPTARLTVDGLDLDLNSDDSVAGALITGTLSKNDALAKTFSIVSILPTIDAGALNANVGLNVLDIDTVNTDDTGVSTNLIKASFGGQEKFKVDALGNLTISGEISADSLTLVNPYNNGVSITSDVQLPVISTAGKVLNSATSALSTNDPLAIVSRDAFGNFAAGTITATLDGLAENISGLLSVANGGTGLTSLPLNALLVGNGTGALLSISAPTSGQILIGDGSGAPSFVSFSGDIGVDATGLVSIAANSIGDNELVYDIGQNLNTTASPVFAGLNLSNPLAVLSGGSGTTTSTGSGSLVLSTSPQLTTPNLGAAVATSLNKLTITTPATGATLSIADGKTLGISNSITFAGVDSTIFTLPSATDTLLGRASNDTLTNKTIAAASNVISGLTNTNLSGSAGISNANLANASITINSGTGLSGGATVALGGNVSLTNTGVVSITGTANQVISSGATGALTLSLPQSIGTSSTPSFGGMSLSTPLSVLSGGSGTSTSTGSGSLVLSTSPQLTTPNLGVAVATSVNKLTITAPATAATLTIGDGKTLSVNNTLSFSGTDSTSFTLPSATDTLIGRASSDTLTNKIISGASNTLSSIANSALSNSSITINSGTGLSGGATVALGGNISLTNSGVTSITGTSNQVISSGGTGAITLSLPQSIGTSSSPTFNSVSLTSALGVTSGGTGLASVGSANQILGVNSGGTAYEYKTLNVGTNLSTSHGANSLTVNLSATPTFTTVNGLSLTAAADGVVISGGTTSRSLTLSGGNISINGGGNSLTLSANVSLNQNLRTSDGPSFATVATTAGATIGTALTVGTTLGVTGTTTLTDTVTLGGAMLGSNTVVASGTLANSGLGSSCGLGRSNGLNQAVFQTGATITVSHIFYNVTSGKHVRISDSDSCTDGGGNVYKYLTLQDTLTTAAGQSFIIYNPLSTIGNSTSGFFNTLNSITVRGVFSVLTGGFDVAEEYPTNEELKAGDVVAIDPSSPGYIKKSGGRYDPQLLGVISTNPGLLLGEENIGTWAKVALVGRVPVRVNTENGAIKSGDFLTASSEPGVAMRAVKAGLVIGRALESFDSESTGTIHVYIGLNSYTGSTPTYATTVPTETLKNLLAEQALQPESDSNSFVFTDVLIAEKEIVTPKIAVHSISVDELTAASGDSLIFESKVVFKNGLSTDRIDSSEQLVLGSQIAFSSDTAGFAVIKSGDSKVLVRFTKPYLSKPLVQANILSFGEENEEDVSQSILSSDIRYIVGKINLNSFTIQLNKEAPFDINFGWSAFGVINTEVINSVPTHSAVSPPEQPPQEDSEEENIENINQE